MPFGARLAGNGMRPRDRLAIYLQNDPEWLVAMVGCWLVGAIPVAVNPMLRDDELRHHLGDSGARARVCLDSLEERVAATDARVIRAAELLTAAPADPLLPPETGADDVALLIYGIADLLGRLRGVCCGPGPRAGE